MRVRQELWKAVEEKISGTSEGSTVEMKEKALSYIVLSVTNNILRRIAVVESASDAWRELEVLYSEDLLASRHRLKKKEVQEKAVFILYVMAIGTTGVSIPCEAWDSSSVQR